MKAAAALLLSLVIVVCLMPRCQCQVLGDVFLYVSRSLIKAVCIGVGTAACTCGISPGQLSSVQVQLLLLTKVLRSPSLSRFETGVYLIHLQVYLGHAPADGLTTTSLLACLSCVLLLPLLPCCCGYVLHPQEDGKGEKEPVHFDPFPDLPADFGPEVPEEGIDGLLLVRGSICAGGGDSTAWL
jgi:hypothetical protein